MLRHRELSGKVYLLQLVDFLFYYEAIVISLVRPLLSRASYPIWKILSYTYL